MGLKKITQPLGTKNHTTSRDKKKSRNLLGQKNHATSWDKPNHATSQDNKKTCSQ